MSLAHWVNNQRAAKKIGHLKEDRIRKLEEIGFVWEMRPPRKYHTNHHEYSHSDITPPNYSDESEVVSACSTESEGSTTEEEEGTKTSPPSSPSSVSDCPALSEIEEFFVHEFATHKFWQRAGNRLPV